MADPELKDGNVFAYSQASLGKRDYVKKATARLSDAFKSRLDLTSEMDGGRPPERELDWWGVIHADGSGLGQFFLRFDEVLPDDATARDYITAYRGFSIALENCTRRAAVEAMNAIWPGTDADAQLKPLVLAGDDLTVLCDGRRAVRYARAFMAAFERLTGDDPSMRPMTEIAARADKALLGSASLTSAAGVAIVKPHHPFHRAYALAQELCRSAKRCKQLQTAASAFDFHIAFNQASDLEAIRTVPGSFGGPNWGGPYLIGETQRTSNHAMRGFAMLEDSMSEITAGNDEDGQSIDRSSLHDLRTALHRSPAAVDTTIRCLEHRRRFATARGRLFGCADPRDPAFTNSTLLLDAMELSAIESGACME